jgi:hypothetical protein
MRHWKCVLTFPVPDDERAPARGAEHHWPALGDRQVDHQASGHAASQRIRKWIQETFGWTKVIAGMGKAKLWGLPKVDWHSASPPRPTIGPAAQACEGAGINAAPDKQWRINLAHHLQAARFQFRRSRAGEYSWNQSLRGVLGQVRAVRSNANRA